MASFNFIAIQRPSWATQDTSIKIKKKKKKKQQQKNIWINVSGKARGNDCIVVLNE